MTEIGGGDMYMRCPACEWSRHLPYGVRGTTQQALEDLQAHARKVHGKPLYQLDEEPRERQERETA